MKTTIYEDMGVITTDEYISQKYVNLEICEICKAKSNLWCIF